MELRSEGGETPATCHGPAQYQPPTSGTQQNRLSKPAPVSCVVHWSIDLQIDLDIKNNCIKTQNKVKISCQRVNRHDKIYRLMDLIRQSVGQGFIFSNKAKKRIQHISMTKEITLKSQK